MWNKSNHLPLSAGATDYFPVQRMVSATIPLEAGLFTLSLYHNSTDEKEHLAIVRGNVTSCQDVLVRVHSECFTGDVLGSRRCDCGPQLNTALEMIANENLGMVIYLRQEGRGIGLLQKLRAYNLQDEGYDNVEANVALGHQPDERAYDMAAWILRDWDVRSVRLLTNNPHKVDSLRDLGIRVSARIPLTAPLTPENTSYMRTKARRMNHQLHQLLNGAI